MRKELIRAVIHAESAFNPKAVSPKGATGLMQIMPFHFRRLGITEPFNPKQNIRGGSRILSELQGRYRGNTKLILAAYNAGEEAVRKYGGIPPYRETQNYVKKVLSLESRYRATLRR
ncbi:lytic transglycosylase domain-containing protein [bacterium]|nr:lytic transglycosylase domain-containing protein [bacterium]